MSRECPEARRPGSAAVRVGPRAIRRPDSLDLLLFTGTEPAALQALLIWRKRAASSPDAIQIED